MASGLSESDRQLINEFLDYDEDKDPGRHRYSEMYQKLAKISGSHSLTELQSWISERIGGAYKLPPIIEESEFEAEAMKLRRESLQNKVLAAKNQSDREFLEKLLRSMDRVQSSSP